MQLNVPIFVLSQLNRASETRADRRPSMAELRESGSLEQDGSVVMLLYNSGEDDRSKKILEIAKNRQGELGKIALRFDGRFQNFWETGEPASDGKQRPVNPFE
jgi:replicative DNA helicase